MLAATSVVPLPAAAYCAPAGDSRGCCKSLKRAASQVSIGNHQSADARVSQTCGCHRSPEPQNTPPERTTVPESTRTAALLPSDAMQFHGGVEFTSAIQPASDGHLTAIPHRILHCSWLI
ncbi:MAG: hypothetical protein WD971_13515 [Pirellulales bacterium]